MTTLNTDAIPTTREIVINNERVTVPAGVNFLDWLRQVTRERGITTANYYVNCRELNSFTEVSDEFNAGQILEVKTYCKPGLAF